MNLFNVFMYFLVTRVLTTIYRDNYIDKKVAVLNKFIFIYKYLNWIYKMLCILLEIRDICTKLPNIKNKKISTQCAHVMHVLTAVWVRVPVSRARPRVLFLFASSLSWCECHMTSAWIFTRNLRLNGRPDGETRSPDCVLVKRRATACRRCCKSFSARKLSVTATAAPGTAQRERSSGKIRPLARACYYTYGDTVTRSAHLHAPVCKKRVPVWAFIHDSDEHSATYSCLFL